MSCLQPVLSCHDTSASWQLPLPLTILSHLRIAILQPFNKHVLRVYQLPPIDSTCLTSQNLPWRPALAPAYPPCQVLLPPTLAHHNCLCPAPCPAPAPCTPSNPNY
jgi:hypothetical protein